MKVKLTNKDLDYISDMFEWNYNTLKVVNHYINEVENEEIKEILEEVFDMHYENLNKCISILEGNDDCDCDECDECEDCDCENDSYEEGKEDE